MMARNGRPLQTKWVIWSYTCGDTGKFIRELHGVANRVK